MLTYFIVFIGVINFSIEIRPNNDIVLNFIEENYEAITVVEFYNEIKRTISESECNEIVNTLKTLLNRYVFLDILKIGPEPYFKNEQLDLLKECDNIFTYRDMENFVFYRKMQKVINMAKDGHLSIELNPHNQDYQIYEESKAISPYKFEISKEGKVYAIPSNYISFFSQTIQNAIKKNKNKKVSNIKLIIGYDDEIQFDPLEYISLFNQDYDKLKSEQAQFVQNQINMEEFSLFTYPFLKENITNLIIVYSDDTNIKFDYLVLRPKIIFNALFKEFINNNSYKLNGGIKRNTNLYELSKKFLIKNKLLVESNDIVWDKSTINDELKCKIDKDNEINVIYQNDFSFKDKNNKDDDDIAYNILDECFKLFDKNNYKIVIIEDFNGGGSGAVSNYFTEYLNLKNPYYVYGAYRNNNDVKNYIANGERRDIKTCKNRPVKDFFSPQKEIDYGKDPDGAEVKHQITQLFVDLDISETQKNKIYDLRKNSKNIRKPNEIIIFTDGYSFSATSSFIKEVQLRKGAIIVGYGGNPKNKNFDSCESPSSVEDTEGKRDQYEQAFEDKGFTLRFTTIEYFKYYNNIKYPMEFETTFIDERVNLYNKYDDSRYQEFIDEAKNIFNKYDNGNCNPKNKNILLQSDECKFSNDPHALGGYECGDDGKWTKNCVPFYCEIGYYFDIEQKTCISDPCYSIYEEEMKKKEEEEIERKWKIFLGLWIGFLLLCVCFLIVFSISFYFNKKENKECFPNAVITFGILTIVLFLFFIIFFLIWLIKYHLKK